MVYRNKTFANSVVVGLSSGKVELAADSGDLLIKSGGSTATVRPGLGIVEQQPVVIIANKAALPLPPTGITNGALYYTTASSELFMKSGGGWYRVSMVNTSPSITLNKTTASITTSTLTLDVNYTTVEPEGTPVTIALANSGIADTNVATITHTTANNNIRVVFDGSTDLSDATITATVTDGVNTGVGTITFSTAYAVKDSRNTLVLLKANSEGGDNYTFSDQSDSNHTITPTGYARTSSFSPYRPNGYAQHINGGRYIDIAASSDFSFSGQWSVEFWFWGDEQQSSSGTSGWHDVFQIGSSYMEINNDGYCATGSNMFGSVGSSVSGETHPILWNRWNHIAYTRDGSNVVRHYVNGRYTNKATVTGSAGSSSNAPRLGLYTSEAAECFLYDVRISNTARYTSEYGFDLPTAPFESDSNTMALVCTGSMLKDYGPNSHAVTTNTSGTGKQIGHTPFDRGAYDVSKHGNSAIITNARSSSYVKLPRSADLYDWNPSSNHFTLEFWLYSRAFRVGSPNNSPCVFSHATGSDNTFYWGFGTNTSGNLYFYYYNGSAQTITASTTMYTNQWYHCAFYKDNSGNIKIYLNGVQDASTTVSGTPQTSSSTDVWIGRAQNNTVGNFNIADVRIVKGEAVYTGAFTPPTGPLTKTGGTYSSTTNVNTGITASNTKLLLNFPAGIEDLGQCSEQVEFYQSDSTDVEGDTGVVKYGGKPTIKTDFSAGFTSIHTPLFELYNSPWTIEMWVRLTQSGQASIFFDSDAGTYGGNLSARIDYADSSRIFYTDLGLSASYAYTNSEIVFLNTWNHLVFQQNPRNMKDSENGILTIWANGTVLGSMNALDKYASATADTATWNALRLLGAQGPGGGYSAFTGNSQDIRVSSGARYPFMPVNQTLTTTNSARTGVTATGSNTKLLAFTTTTTTTDVTTNHTITSQGDPTGVSWGPVAGMKSVYLDGTGDYFTIPNHADFNFGTGAYTIEFWINTRQTYAWIFYNANSNTGVRISIGNEASSSPGQIFLNEQVSNNSSNYYSHCRIDDGSWHHVAFCRDGVSRRVFVDGKLEHKNALTNRDLASGTVGHIGRKQGLADATQFKGYISNFRWIKGQALYAETFTPPSALLTG
jgi:hypothetical protein